LGFFLSQTPWRLRFLAPEEGCGLWEARSELGAGVYVRDPPPWWSRQFFVAMAGVRQRPPKPPGSSLAARLTLGYSSANYLLFQHP